MTSAGPGRAATVRMLRTKDGRSTAGWSGPWIVSRSSAASRRATEKSCRGEEDRRHGHRGLHADRSDQDAAQQRPDERPDRLAEAGHDVAGNELLRQLREGRQQGRLDGSDHGAGGGDGGGRHEHHGRRRTDRHADGTAERTDGPQDVRRDQDADRCRTSQPGCPPAFRSGSPAPSGRGRGCPPPADHPSGRRRPGARREAPSRRRSRPCRRLRRGGSTGWRSPPGASWRRLGGPRASPPRRGPAPRSPG